MTRQQHLDWAKERAREYIEQGDLQNAVASIMSDLNKHDDTRELLQNGATNLLMLDMMLWPREDKVRRFIEDLR